MVWKKLKSLFHSTETRTTTSLRKGRHVLPLRLEALEDRTLLAASFLQGYAFIDNNANNAYDQGTDTAKVGATITLSPLAGGGDLTATTNVDGYYRFDNVAAGNYRLTESAPGFVALGEVKSTINSGTLSGAGIDVTVYDPGTQSITIQQGAAPYSPYESAKFQLLASANNAASPFNFQPSGGWAGSGTTVHQLNLALTGNAGNSHSILSLCTDLFHFSGSTPYVLTPSTTPNTTTLTTNLGQIGYLYNHYGRFLQPGGPQNNASVNGAGLALAMWELEYDSTPDLLNGNFQVLSTANPNVLAAANYYLSQSAGKDERAFFLNNTTAPLGSFTVAQGMITTDLFNFANRALPTIQVIKSGPASVGEGGANTTYSFTITNTSPASAGAVTVDSVVDTKLGNLTAAALLANGNTPIVLATGASFSFNYNTTISGNAGTSLTNVVTVSGHNSKNDTATDDDDHTATFTDVLPTITVTKDGAATILEGGTTTYTFTITNTSASTDPVTITSITDDVLGNLLPAAKLVNGGNDIVLQPNGTFTFQFSTTVAYDAGTVVNTVTVTGKDDENNSTSAQDNHTLTVLNVNPTLNVVKTGPGTLEETDGTEVTYTFTITNTSPSSTDPVTVTSVSDDKLGDLTADALAAYQLLPGNSGASVIVLAPGASLTFTKTATVDGNAGDTITNVVTVTGHDDENTPASDTDDHTLNFGDDPPSITVVKSGLASINEGQTHTYYFTITNNSSATDPVTITAINDDVIPNLYDEALADYQAQPGFSEATAIVIQPGESFTFDYTTGSLDAGVIVNTVTVDGHDDEDTPACDKDSHTLTVLDVAPTLTVVKSGPATIAEGGANATYTFTITNTSASTDPLTITNVSDTVLGDLLDEAEAAYGGTITLASGASFSFDVTASVTGNVGGSHTNVVTVTGHDDEGGTATDDDDHTVHFTDVAPTITVDKTGPISINEGQSATVTFTITNNSSPTDPVTITSVVDDKLGDLTAKANDAWVAQGHTGPIVLAPGAGFTFTVIGPVLNAGSLTNVVTVTGHDDENTPASDTDDHTVTVLDAAPAVSVTKTANKASISEGGVGDQTVTYTYTITASSLNSTTDPLTVTSVIDDRLGDLLDEAELANGGTIVLTPGQSFHFDVTTTLAAQDAGDSLTNTVTVKGKDDENTPSNTTTATATVTYDDVAPSVSITKSHTGTINEGTAGQTLVYSFTVTNTSAATTDTLTVTSLDDPLLGGSLLSAFVAANGGSAVLAHGQSVTFTKSYSAPVANAGVTIDNTVTVTGHDDDSDNEVTATASDSETYKDLTPTIKVVKSASVSTPLPGDTVVYTYTVTNESAASTDPLTLTSLLDDNGTPGVTGDDKDILVVGTFAGGDTNNNNLIDKGETWTYTWSTSAPNVSGAWTNTVVATGKDDENNTDTDTATATINVLQPASLSGYVYLDANNDGTFQGTESPISGVTVTLTGTDDLGNPVSASTTTNSVGYYEFTGLRPGTYTITETQPSAYLDGKDTQGTPGNGTTTNDQFSTISLVAGVNGVNNNFGELPKSPKIDIEKKTDGPTNSNTTDPTYNNEDTPDGAGVPILTAGSAVTWTYQVTNTGDTPFARADVVITDDAGTTDTTADDLSTTNGGITFLSYDTGDTDAFLEPGEVWVFTATGTVQALSSGLGAAATFDFSGSSPLDGSDGNVRSYAAGSVNLKATAFSRDKASGAWADAYLGAYGGGLGVTDSGEGDGSSNKHTVDNIGRDNYILFAFDQSVVVDSAYLGYVVSDSDLKVWIGTLPNAYATLPELSDTVLSGLGFTEVNSTTLTAARLADLNAGGFVGNVLVIAADPGDTTPEDQFKVEKVKVNTVLPGVYKNLATVTAPGATDCDLSHYKNPAVVAANASLSGFVYADTNNDGIKQGTEAGIAGATVTLTGTDDLGNAVSLTTTSASTGAYSFTNLRPGTYTLTETQPAGYLDGKDTVGTPGGTTTNDKFSAIVLGAGVNGANNNFGELKPASISGNVFDDCYADGVKYGPDEPGLQGFVVYLDANGNNQLDSGEASTTTDAYGDYSFADLLAGTYKVREVLKPGWRQTTANPADVVLATGGSKTGVDFGNAADKAALSNITYVINGTTTVTDLRDNVHQGDTVTVHFTVAAGVTGIEVALVSYVAPAATFDASTAYLQRVYKVDTGIFAAGEHSLTVEVPNCYFQIDFITGCVIETFGAPGSTGFYTPQGRLISADNGGTQSCNTGSLSGFVFVDANNNGTKDSGEAGIGGVTVMLTGTTDAGASVSLTRVTAADGSYSFTGLQEGTYTVTETQPAGYLDGKEQLGTLGGTKGADVFSSIDVRMNDRGLNYNFGELLASKAVSSGDTATIGYWQNKNGQALIKSLNGSSSARELSKWLATTYPKLFGAGAGNYSMVNSDGTYKTNSQVASAYKAFFFGVTGQKTYAQIFASALATYVTSSTLAGGGFASSYGFNVTPAGIGLNTINVGTNGAAFGVANGSTISVSAALAATNAASNPGSLYKGNTANINKANAVYTSINETGDIQLFSQDSGQEASTAALLADQAVLASRQILVEVDGLDEGDAGAAEQARIGDALASLNVSLADYGVVLIDIGAGSDLAADVYIRFDTQTVFGGVEEGVLGLTSFGGAITLVTGWDWYLGSDPSEVGAGQYDFQTIVTHEIGHAIGFGHSTQAGSTMFPYLGTGETKRDLTAGDLANIHAVMETEPEPLLAAPPKGAKPAAPAGNTEAGQAAAPAIAPAGPAAGTSAQAPAAGLANFLAAQASPATAFTASPAGNAPFASASWAPAVSPIQAAVPSASAFQGSVSYFGGGAHEAALSGPGLTAQASAPRGPEGVAPRVDSTQQRHDADVAFQAMRGEDSLPAWLSLADVTEAAPDAAASDACFACWQPETQEAGGRRSAGLVGALSAVALSAAAVSALHRGTAGTRRPGLPAAK